jgi:hypothetical protein
MLKFSAASRGANLVHKGQAQLQFKGFTGMMVALLVLIAASLSQDAFAQKNPKNPEQWSRPDNKCPPTDETPIPGRDKALSGKPDDPVDWLRKTFHWDDENGNDLTLEIWCVRSSRSFSARIFLSKDGESAMKASPGGENGTEATGQC